MNKNHIKYLLALLFSAIIFSANAVIAPSDSIFRPMKDTVSFKKKMKDFSATFTSFECSFDQVKTMSMLKAPSSATGSFCYRSGGDFRWEYSVPFSYILVIRNGKLTVRDESGKNQVNLASSKTFAEVNGKIISLISGKFLEEKGEFAHRLSENDYLYKVELDPLNKRIAKYFRSIEIQIDKANMTASRLILEEQDGDKTAFTFFNKKINQAIGDEKFIIR
jgi:outer membrane lipoprotein-sorting protein